MKKIDIGGTPSNILGKTKKELACSLGYGDKSVVALLDPFNLARLERILPLGKNYKIKQIKFSVETPISNTDLSSEVVASPNPEVIKDNLISAKPKILGKMVADYGWRLTDKKELERRYDQLIEEIPNLAKSSGNLRDFMNSLVEKFLNPVKTILIENVFSKSPEKTYALIKKFKVPARAICPGCNTFRNITLGENLSCCNVSSDEIIKSGRFIPEEGFFPVLTFLNGYQTFTPEGKDYTKKAQQILEDLGISGKKVAIEYTIPKDSKTCFEEFLLKDLISS